MSKVKLINEFEKAGEILKICVQLLEDEKIEKHKVAYLLENLEKQISFKVEKFWQKIEKQKRSIE
ncbi:MAG: hypothetical protein PHS78_06410 [Aliarcobacter skirrowii]|uniref:hypothetical protein n=1 Tax=Aliarcobacter skirrowii TaxID=28200 RepID=UPI0024301F02|nr:hypothetical protein [Aliarcobacter skirrowii]MDD2508655.1 hypothetical protein [Aliarcobacter skirrowii]MDD3496867.1 hypothetical protein [Aliarcobacter skirrowii]